MTIWKIFIGGAADTTTEIVESYYRAYKKANPDYRCQYFSWDEGAILNMLLTREAKDGNVTLVGHSYGGDTAFWQMGHVPRVDLLISIDPVARFKRDWVSIRAGAKVWLNVRAEADAQHRAFDDTIAAIGGKYPRPPQPGQPGAPDYSFFANTNHGDFPTMMRGNAHGISAQQLLGGNIVG